MSLNNSVELLQNNKNSDLSGATHYKTICLFDNLEPLLWRRDIHLNDTRNNFDGKNI